MYIKLICKYCLPSEFKNIGHRHVQINKIILNIANCLGSNIYFYLFEICSVQVVGLLFGKHWKIIQSIIIDIFWERNSYNSKEKMMLRFCIKVWIQFLQKVANMKISIFSKY